MLCGDDVMRLGDDTWAGGFLDFSFAFSGAPEILVEYMLGSGGDNIPAGVMHKGAILQGSITYEDSLVGLSSLCGLKRAWNETSLSFLLLGVCEFDSDEISLDRGLWA